MSNEKAVNITQTNKSNKTINLDTSQNLLLNTEQKLDALRLKSKIKLLKVPSSVITDSQNSPISEQQAALKRRPSLLVKNSRRFSLLEPSSKFKFFGINNLVSTEASQKNIQLSSQNSPMKTKPQCDFQIHETDSNNTNKSSSDSDSSDTSKSEIQNPDVSIQLNQVLPIPNPNPNQNNNSNPQVVVVVETEEEIKKKKEREEKQKLKQEKKEQKEKLKQEKEKLKQEKEKQKEKEEKERKEQEKIKKKRKRFNLKGLFGTLIDEMNPILIVMLSTWSFLHELSMTETLQNQDNIANPDLVCKMDNNNNQCVQKVSIIDYVNCLDEYYEKLYSFRYSGDFYCGENGFVPKSEQSNYEQIYFKDAEFRDGENFPVGEAIILLHELLFLTLVIIAMIIYLRKYGQYGTGSYVTFSLRLEYISWYRNWIKITTAIFVISMGAAVLYYSIMIGDIGIIYPVSSFTVLLVIQFRYMLLKRRLWLNLEDEEFQNAVFNRKGIWEYILSNNFIYFNALERAAKEDLKNNNHDQLNQMVLHGNVQAIQNILFNRETWEKNDTYGYFKIFDEDKLPEKPVYHKCIHWKSIIFIITNEFRELITIFSQLLLSTITLTQFAYIQGNDDNLDCHLTQEGTCETKLYIAEYYDCITQYINGYFVSNIFSHQEAYCDKGTLLYEIPDGRHESEYHIITIEYYFLAIKILLWLILLGTVALMIDLVFQYIQNKSGKYNSGQFLAFCLKIDQTLKFKFLSKLLFALYFICNLAILILLIVYQDGAGVLACIQSTFSVLSEFRVLIFNQRIIQNIEDPAFQQAEFHRGGLGWFVWIYSDKYFNYLELAAMDDLEHQKGMQLDEEDDLENRDRRISRQRSNVSRPIRSIDTTKVESMTDSYLEQLKFYPHLSQYVVSGDIQKIAQILLYRR